MGTYANAADEDSILAMYGVMHLIKNQNLENWIELEFLAEHQ